MIYEISYANDRFRETQRFHAQMAEKRGGFDKVITYNEKDLDENFRKKNKDILAMPRGGYWVWKAHIINMTLEKMEENDYLFYVDSGAVILHPVQKLISVMESNNDDIMVFEVYGRTEIEYTKRDVYKYFDFETEDCLKSNQIMSGFILVKKNPNTVRIFKEYEKASQEPNLLLDGVNVLTQDGDYPEFVAHRHDQSILSVLLKKNGVRPYRDPSQWGLYQSVRYRQRNMTKKEEYAVFEKSQFPKMMFFLHRQGNYNPARIYLYKDIARVYFIYLKYWFNKDKVV